MSSPPFSVLGVIRLGPGYSDAIGRPFRWSGKTVQTRAPYCPNETRMTFVGAEYAPRPVTGR
jgi:hypothetical protein